MHGTSLNQVMLCSDDKMPLTGYMKLLKPGGILNFVGLPEAGLPKVPPSALIMNVSYEMESRT